MVNFSAIPHLKCAFSTRSDGNLSPLRGADRSTALPRARLFLQRHQIDPHRTVKCRLSHGTRITPVSLSDGGRGIIEGREPIDATDGLITSHPGLFLYLITADCLPVLVVDPVQRVVGIAHAGWRGTAADIAGKLIRQMQMAYHVDPAHIHVLIGPAICSQCYEVGQDVRDVFQQQFAFDPKLIFSSKLNGKFDLDLIRANRLQLQAAGVPAAQIFETGICTKEYSDRYYSVRAEGLETGRFASVIGFTA